MKDAINKLVGKVVSPGLSAVLGFLTAHGVILPEGTDVEILGAVAIVVAAVAVPVIEAARKKVVGWFN